ncbi:AAA family ATPase [Chamaesiphon sp.]|uniref:AAA family ATPase n=1 Tax=Chamaesiphon sp. TaxID=2814140 RepID=UPI003593199A
MGYEIEYRPHGQFEIVGYDREHLEDFSKRRMQILSECPGNSTWQTREESWQRTRKHKERIPQSELKARWQQEAADLGIEIVRSGLLKVERNTTTATKDRYIEDAIVHCSERSVDFRVEDIEKFIIAQRLPIDITEISSLCDDRLDLIKLDGNYTTYNALVREDRTISLMRGTKAETAPIASSSRVADYLQNTTLNAGQRQAIGLAATTADRVIAWQGVAGAGKTSALAELKQLANLNEVEVKGFAPSAEAAKVLSDELGIEAQTVARKLCSREELPSKDELWIVDEAGLLSADDALALLSRAKKENARVLLVGDTRQLSSVAAGNPFRSLQAAGMATARLTVSLRQKDPNLKAAVDALADGEIDRGFALLEQNNSIVTVAKDEIAIKIAAEYLALSPAQRAKTLIVSGTNDKRREITTAIREGLRASGSIGPDIPTRQLVDYKFTKVENCYAHNYSVGDIVVPIHNYNQLVKGQSYVVADKEADCLVLRSPDGERLVTDLNFDKAHYREESIGVAVGDRLRWSKNDAQLQRRNGQEFEIESTVEHLANLKYRDGRTEAIDLAIATTIYGSQGKTSDLVLVAADGVQNSESFYVAASRAKSELKIFTDSPDNLRSMVMESMSNRNPRELLSDLDRRQAILKAQKQHGVDERSVLQVKVEPLLDNVNERKDELEKQESVKVPTHGGSVKVPTHGGDVGTLTSREDELDTNPVR